MYLVKIAHVLVVLLLSVALMSCGLTMSPNHPLDGKWVLIQGTLPLPASLEFEPSTTVTGDNVIHGRFALTDQGDIRLVFPRYTWTGKMVLTRSTLQLTDTNGTTNTYTRTSFCSSEMGTPCPYDP